VEVDLGQASARAPVDGVDTGSARRAAAKRPEPALRRRALAPLRSGFIIVTSHRGFEASGEILGDARSPPAPIDRLVRNDATITLKGKRYRQRERGTDTLAKAKPSRQADSTEL
jgi:hypothetical protein